MEFSPFNPIVKLCLQGMEMEANGARNNATALFQQAWNDATNDFEKFLAAHYLARQQETVSDELHWLEQALQYALKVNNDAANSALPALYQQLASCHTTLGDASKAKVNADLASAHLHHPSDKGPFYHGTKADLKPGDLLTPGGDSNYKPELRMHHIYFTAMANGAGLAAALAKGDGAERVYIVEPTGSYENDPNVTDQKFPGNPTRSYRSESPLKIIGEVKEWAKPAPEDLQSFREKLANNSGNIIN